MTRNLLSILTLLVLTVTNARATTYYVAPNGNNSNPGTQAQPFQTIVRGMGAAQNGDTVLVADGTYTGFGNYDLNFSGRNFTLRSQNGAANCIINPGGDDWLQFAGRGFLFISGETQQMVVDGFTIKHGNTGNSDTIAGGGALIVGSSPTFRNCVFFENRASGSHEFAAGGAVFVADGSPTFINCSFLENNATSYDVPAAGGGMGIQGNSNVTLTGCTFSGNGAASVHITVGGGLYLVAGARATLTDCTFNGNVADSNYIGVGGAIGILSGQATLQNCTFNGNLVRGYGAGQAGGVYVEGQGNSLTLTNCSLFGNNAWGTTGPAYGGGACATGGSQLLLVNTLVVNNYTKGATVAKGGGVSSGGSGTNTRLVHCVVTQNRAFGTGSGGGIMADTNGSISLTNCIVYNNHAPNDVELHTSGGVITPTYCNIGGYPATPDSNHNFGADPRFVRNPSWGADGNIGTADDDLGDLHLQSGSPCRDTGMVSPANAVPYDKDIHERLVGFAPDLGAYEFGSPLYVAAHLYVDTVSGIDLPGRGTSSAPFRTVNMALSRVTAPLGFTVIHVKQGNYGSDRSTITKRVRFVNWGNTGQARIGKQ